MLTGGGAMHLNDSIGKEKRIKYICCHHEQSCAMAAESYARISGQIGVIIVTSGPGGINALNGVVGAWTDAIPMLIISGQVKKETCLSTYKIPNLRQLGDQECDIIKMVQGITKYSVLVRNPNTIKYHLEKAIYLAEQGPPGPCWLDIPLDVQSSMIDELKLKGFDIKGNVSVLDSRKLFKLCKNVIEKIESSKRPVIMAGTGIRLAKALDVFDTVIHKLQIPVTTAWTHDIIASDDPLFCGRPGTIGTRGGNFTVQNSDLLLIIGARLNVRQVSYNWQSFAREAYKIQIDADIAEFKRPMVKIDMPIHCDARVFLEEFYRQLVNSNYNYKTHQNWLSWCQERVNKYPPVLEKHRIFNGKINPYHFVDTLFRRLGSDDIIVCANATATIVTFQVANIKKGQRIFSNSGSASMGYDLPAAIGAATAAPMKRIICLAGDGSIQLNIQELQTIFANQLNIKIFVLNNNGYLSIRISQLNFFKRFVGESPISGITFPDICKVAHAYKIKSYRINSQSFVDQIDTVLNQDGPVLCEVILDPNQAFEPKTSSRQLSDGRIVSAPLEDMYPFLDRKELLENMLIDPIDE